MADAQVSERAFRVRPNKSSADRLINITIAQDTTPIRVQQVLLEAASPWFEKALQRDAFLEGKEGKLDFPDDDREAWECAIYWMINREAVFDPPNGGALVLLVKCWALGEKFQDECMLTLIHYFEDSALSPETHDLDQIFELIRPGSKLARLFAEELIHIIFRDRPPAMKWEQLTALSNIGNLWSAIGEAQGKLISNSAWHFGYRLDKASNSPHWTEYMVGDIRSAIFYVHTIHYRTSREDAHEGALSALYNGRGSRRAWKLKSDRFIKLFLGKNNDELYLVPESRLKQTSEYFANAIKHESWGPDNIGKLHFPDDGKDAFELLIHFIVNGSMPVFNLYKSRDENSALQKTLIDSWVMADKYLIHDFQDQVMLKLLETVDFFPSDWEVVRHAFETGSEGSKIWTLFAEEAVFMTYYGMPRKIQTPDEIRKLERAIIPRPREFGSIRVHAGRAFDLVTSGKSQTFYKARVRAQPLTYSPSF
ncbi:uncharacterized protein MYCFIDRAFT_83776 [Pseudocercospora fijiensis CIRAD86]|uniref:BTB domain-containing protein n=1 Tax=Pseudocercospora fijiensis (strain CIRAD86) TaxID=383855 RepID=M3A2Y1_PSEFD|nr:uncharacterized protein MYCFIDRAFT_83776 [Pseudocercospora fijiensis CIRAD86]EME78881.1 hypothetical protein MYCFIDRAFT_83776 [Pseudocercospora fijiensis CIRAD86]